MEATVRFRWRGWPSGVTWWSLFHSNSDASEIATYASEKRLGISDKMQRSPRIPPYTNAIVGRNALVLHSGKDTGPFPFDTTRAYENRAEEPTDCSVRFGNDVMDQQSRLGSVHHRIIATRHSILKEIARMQNLRGS